jgi:hypothetical protein
MCAQAQAAPLSPPATPPSPSAASTASAPAARPRPRPRPPGSAAAAAAARGGWSGGTAGSCARLRRRRRRGWRILTLGASPWWGRVLHILYNIVIYYYVYNYIVEELGPWRIAMAGGVPCVFTFHIITSYTLCRSNSPRSVSRRRAASPRSISCAASRTSIARNRMVSGGVAMDSSGPVRP